MKNLPSDSLSPIPVTVGRFPFGAACNPRMLYALGDRGRPYNMRYLSAPVDEASAALSRAISLEKDKVISGAISAALNDGPWTLEAIAPRLRRNYDVITHIDMWVLDGEPLLEIWPFELRPQHEAGSEQWMINASFRFYIYPRTGGAC